MSLSFESYPAWLNILIFLISTGLIWFVGTRLEWYADTISERTGLGEAFIGLLLLSVATSLPELATTVTAVVFLNNPTLAVHNLLGGVALQTAIIIVADKATGKEERGALTFFSPNFVLLIEGIGVLVLLQLIIAGTTVKGIPLLGTISIWPTLVFFSYLGIMYLTHRYEGHPRWRPVDNKKEEEETEKHSGKDPEGGHQKNSERENSRSMMRLWLLFSGAALIVLIAGWGAAQSADILAKKTGLGSAFLGATFLALATSMPELSTTITASHSGRYSMAISNIFGSNAFDISLLFLAELLYYKGTVIQYAKDASVLFIASIGALMTCIYLWGLMERENRTVFGIGWDSTANLLIYLGAVTILYFMG